MTASPQVRPRPQNATRPRRAPAPSAPPVAAAGLRKDVEASLVVFLVALPLSLGIAVASGAPVAAGIIAAVVGGVVAGAVGGVPLQVSGPAAGLTALVAETVTEFGWKVTCAATVVAGLLQLAFGVFKVARAALAISPAVVHGMLAGIGVTIVLGQTHVLLGGAAKASALVNITELPGQLLAVHQVAVVAGIATVAINLVWPMLPPAVQAIPAPLASVVLVTVAALPFDVPRVTLPGGVLGAIGLPQLPQGQWGAFATAAGTIAIVASVESLLSAVAVDKMHDGPRGDLDRELVGQGAANTVSGMLGGLPVTGVIVRSSTNARAGARTRLSAILHGVWVAVFAILLVGLVQRVPLAVLAGLLVVIGAKLVNAAHYRAAAKHHEHIVYAVTIGGVVLLNLLEGVLVGIAVALVLALRGVLNGRTTVTRPTAAGGPWRVTLTGTHTFVSLPRTSRVLAGVPAGVPVVVELDVDFLDHAAYEHIDDWAQAHTRGGGEVRLEEVGAPVLARILRGQVPKGRIGLGLPRQLAPWWIWQRADEGAGSVLAGVEEYNQRTGPKLSRVFGHLAAGQRPSTLFITCADSRLVPNVITSSGPGDLFTVRSVGNFVPHPLRALDGDSTGAAVEYGVEVLGVSSIVVCGHSGCGAMSALLDGAPGHLPALRQFIDDSREALEEVIAVAVGSDDDTERGPVDRLARANVMRQLRHLTEYPCVARAVQEGRLELIGLYFDIGSAKTEVLTQLPVEV